MGPRESEERVLFPCHFSGPALLPSASQEHLLPKGSTSPGFLPGGTLLSPSREGHTLSWSQVGAEGGWDSEMERRSPQVWDWVRNGEEIAIRDRDAVGIKEGNYLFKIQICSYHTPQPPATPDQAWQRLPLAFGVTTSYLHVAPMASSRSHSSRPTQRHVGFLLSETKCLSFISSRH